VFKEEGSDDLLVQIISKDNIILGFQKLNSTVDLITVRPPQWFRSGDHALGGYALTENNLFVGMTEELNVWIKANVNSKIYILLPFTSNFLAKQINDTRGFRITQRNKIDRLRESGVNILNFVMNTIARDMINQHVAKEFGHAVGSSVLYRLHPIGDRLDIHFLHEVEPKLSSAFQIASTQAWETIRNELLIDSELANRSGSVRGKLFGEGDVDRFAAEEPEVRCIDYEWPKPEAFGREDEIGRVARALAEGRPAVVAGGPGMGKTTVAVAAMYDPAVKARFGRRRVFATVEDAPEPRAFLAKLADALGLPASGDEASLLRAIENACAAAPVAAILDNAETALDADVPEGQRILRLLAQVPNLSLAVTMRGVPVQLRADAEVLGDLAPLQLDAARSAFLAVAGPEFEHDPFLDPLLESTLDGHALSIQLVAAQAVGLPSLAGLHERWNEERGTILKQEGAKESRLTSGRASLALSLKSLRMAGQPLARRLLALLAYLPAGLAESDVKDLLGEKGTVSKAKAIEAADRLRQLRLVESRVEGRLRMSTPLRESARLDVPLHPSDRDRLLGRFLKLAEVGELIGTKNWARVREAVEAEIGNLDSVCDLALRIGTRLNRVVSALVGACEVTRFSGLGSTHTVLRAASDSRIQARPELMAQICFAIGALALDRSDYKTARKRFEQALPLYRSVENIVRIADCIWNLGRLALGQSDNERAQQRYEEALPLFRKAGSVAGEADCLRQMGELAARRLDHNLAQRRLEEALPLYRKVGDLLGEANCILTLGELSWRSKPEAAQERFHDALQLYREIGSVGGEANCICCIGEVALARSDHSAARQFFEDAVALYRRVGDLHGEALALIRKGQLAQFSENRVARAHFDEALALLERNPKDLALPGWRAFHAALVAADPAIAVEKREEARAHWTRVGRLDLVDRFLDLPVVRDGGDSAAA
jgi:tetratricopeptide (TPR) repeat protein